MWSGEEWSIPCHNGGQPPTGTSWPPAGRSTATTSSSRPGPGCAVASCWACAAAGVFPELGRIEVIEVRYEAGRFGRGFKAEPKSLASV
jgi:hypothetical protein